MVRWALGNSRELVGTPEKCGDLGGNKGGTDSDGDEKENVGMFGHIKRRDETENIIAVVEMNMEGKHPRGRLRLTGKVRKESIQKYKVQL